MIGQGQEHGRPKLSQVPYTGAEAVKKIFEQFSQMSASLNRFSVQLESIQDSAKHISVEFHALAFQMRASRSLFSNDHHGGGQRSGLASHFAHRGGGGGDNFKSDQEILASFTMRENAKILIRKQLAAKNNVKDPTLNDDEVLADYEKMLVRKSQASQKFYDAEKAKREVVDSNNTTQDQRDHIEYLKKKMEWTRKFNENPTLVATKQTESKDRHVEYLKEKIKWTEAFNALPDTVRDRLAKENARNVENLSKYRTFLETKSLLYEKFQNERRLQSEADKEKDDVKRKKDHPMPGDVGAYKRAQGVNTYKKEQTESAGALNNYVEYLVAKEIEYRAHQDRLAALRVSSKKDHKDPDEKPLEPFNKRTYVSTLDQPESLAEDINKFGEHYQKPLRSYVNYLTEKENVTAAHKKTMAAIKNADPTPEGQRRAAKKQKAEDDYQESIKGKTKEEIALIKPPEDMREDWYADKIAKLKVFHNEMLEQLKWFNNAKLAETARGNDNYEDLYREKEDRKQNSIARKKGKTYEPSKPLKKETVDSLVSGGYEDTKDPAIIASEATPEIKQSPSSVINVTSEVKESTPLDDITQLVQTLKNVNVITTDIETITDATAPIGSKNHPFNAEIIQVSMIMRDDKGKDLLDPLMLFITKEKDDTKLNQDDKFKGLNESYIESMTHGTAVSNEDAAKQMTKWIAQSKKIDPTAIINRKGTYEDEFADAGNDPAKKALGKLFGEGAQFRRDQGIGIGSKASASVNSDAIIKQLISIEKKQFGSSVLQNALTKKAIDIATREGKHDLAKEFEAQSQTPEGKTRFTIEVQQEEFDIKSEGTTHDASTDTNIQDQILRKLIASAKILHSNIDTKTPTADNFAGILKNLLTDSGQAKDPVMSKASEALASMIKKFYGPQQLNIQSINEKEGDAKLQIKKGTANVTDENYIGNVKALLSNMSKLMGIDIYKIFDKIKIVRGESIKGKDGEYQGRVGTSGEGENLKQSLSLAIPDAAIFGKDAEARAKLIAVIMEEAFVHGLSNKIPKLFGNSNDVFEAQTELQSTYGEITKQTPEELAGAFDQGKYLSSFEELLSSVLKGIAGHNVSGLKDQNLPEGNFKYALNGISPILTAIKNALTGPILAALLVPMVIASTAGAGALEDERIAGFVNKKDGVEGSYIMDANAGRNFGQEDIIRRRTSTGPNAVEASIYGAREQKKIDDAKPSSAVQGIYQIRAEKEAEVARVAALKKKAEDAKAAQLAGPPPTEEETAALEETKEKEKADKDKKEQAWLAAGGVHGPGSTWPLTPPVEKPKTLDETIKNVVDAVVAIPAAIQNANINSPPLLRPKPVVNKPGSTPINTPFSSVIPTNNQAPQAPFHTTLPAPKPTPSFSLPGIPLTPKPLPTYEKPVSKKDQKYITTPLNIKDPLTSPHIKDADTYQTQQGPLRFITGDAPETGKPNVKGSELDQPGGKEAHEAARKFVAAAKKVEAKIAVDSTGRPKKDAYGRLLGDILLDGVSLIETLASEGHLHVSEEAGNEKPLELMKEAARLKKGLWSKKNVKPDKWRKFTPAQKEAHIKDVQASGNIETPNNTIDEPTTPPPKPLAKPTPTPAPTPASSPNLEPTPSPSPTPKDILTPEVDQVPEEKTSTTFAKLIALALGTAGLAGATLFRVLNKKKKEQEKPIAKPKSKPKPKPVTSLPKNKPTPEAAPKATPPAGTPKKNRFLDYRYDQLKDHQEFAEPRKGNNPDGSPNWQDFEIEDNANVNKEIERRDNFKPGIPGTLSKNKDNEEVYTGEDELQYLYQDGNIHTSFGVTGHADPDIIIIPKTPPIDKNTEPRPSIIKPAVAPKPAVAAPVVAPVASGTGGGSSPQTISTTCGACGTNLKLPISTAGKKIKCPKCGAGIEASTGKPITPSTSASTAGSSTVNPIAAGSTEELEAAIPSAPVTQPEEQSQEDKDFEALKDKRKVVKNLAKKRISPEDLTTGVLESVTTPKDGNDEKINAKDLSDSDLENTLNYVESFIFKMIDRIINDEKSTFEIIKDDAGNITDATVNGSMQGDLNSLSTRLTDLHKLKREQRIRKEKEEAENTPEAQPEAQPESQVEAQIEAAPEPEPVKEEQPEAPQKTDKEKSFEKRKGILQRNLKALFKHKKFKRGPGTIDISPQQVLENIPSERFSDEMRPVYDEFVKTVQETGEAPDVPLNTEQSPDEIIQESMDVSAQARKHQQNKTLPYNKNLGFILENDPLAPWRTVDNPYGTSDSGGYTNSASSPSQSNLYNETGFNNTPRDANYETVQNLKLFGTEASDGYGFTYSPDTSGERHPNKGQEWTNTVLNDVTTGRRAEGHQLPPGWFNDIAEDTTPEPTKAEQVKWAQDRVKAITRDQTIHRNNPDNWNLDPTSDKGIAYDEEKNKLNARLEGASQDLRDAENLPDDEPTPTREPARPSKNKAKNVPWKIGDGELYGSAASQIQVPMELMESPEVNAQMEKNHGAFEGVSTTQGLINRSGGLNSHMMLAGLMGHSLSGDQAFKDKTSDFDPATVAYLLQKEVDNFTGADRGDLDGEVEHIDSDAVKNIGEDGRGSLEEYQKKAEAYLKTAANPIFQKIARANLVIVQNQLNRLNDIKRSTAETTTEVKKDEDDEPLVLSEPSDAATEDTKDTKPEITKNPDVTKEEKQEEKKEEAATKINAEAKQAIPRWREEVPAGWAEVLAETLNRYSGEAYKDHDTIDINSIDNAVPITEETTETKETGETKDASTKDPSAKKEYSYTATDPDEDNTYGSWQPTHYTYADNAEEAQQQAQKEFPGHKIDDVEDTADDKATTVLPQAETAIGAMGAVAGAVAGTIMGTAAIGPLGGIIGSLIGGFIGKLGGNLLVGNFNNKRAERFEEREADKKIRQKEKKQKEDEATNTPEIAWAKNKIETKEKEKFNLQNLQSPKDLEAKLQKQKMSGADISDADIDAAVEKQTKAVEASAETIKTLNTDLEDLGRFLADLIKNKPEAAEPSNRDRSIDPEVEHKFLGGSVGGFPGKPRGVDRVPIWAQEGEYVTPKKDVPNMIRALGAYRRRGVSHMARGGVVGGGSTSGSSGSGQTRPSGGSYSSGDILGPFKDKLNDFIKNTKFGAFVSNLTEASAKIQGLSQSMSGMVANASPDTFATFTNSIKLLSGAVGIALIPIFMRASQVIQTWAQQIMNGTGTIGKLFTMFSSIVNTVLDGQLLSIGVGIAIMGAAMLPVIAFFGAMVTGISALIQGFIFLKGAVLASALMMRRTAALPAAPPMAAPLAAGAAPLAAGAVPLATAAVPVASRGAQALAAGKAALGGVGASTGILSGIIGGVTEGIENSDIKSMGAGENATRIGAQAVGGGGGALGGAMGGAAIGTMIFPGIGTVIGGLIGGALGGALGSKVASVGSDAAFGDKRRNEGKKDKDGNTLPEETKKDKAKKDLAMSYQSSKSQSSYSSVEEAYKKIQISALGDDPMTAELKKMNEVGLLNMLKELEKINEGVRGKDAPLGMET